MKNLLSGKHWVMQRVQIAEGFFRQTRQKNAGILCVFQVFLTQYGGKSAGKMDAWYGPVFTKKNQPGLRLTAGRCAPDEYFRKKCIKTARSH